MKIHTRRHGFTLIELLVVISIISLLIAVLLPALSSARESGRQVKCLSNMRQIAFAFPTYVQAEKGYYPVGSEYVGSGYEYLTSPLWVRVAAVTLGLDYITESSVAEPYWALPYHEQVDTAQRYTQKNNGIFQCPSENFPNSWKGKNATSYRYNSGHNNGIYYGYGSSDFYNAHYPGGISSWSAKSGRVRDNQVFTPSTTFLFGESRLTRNASYDYYINQLHGIDYGGDWHNGAGNYLWGDGHASTIKPENLKKEYYDRRK